MTDTNRRWLLAARPVGAVKDSDFTLDSGPVPQPGDGAVPMNLSTASSAVVIGDHGRVPTPSHSVRRASSGTLTPPARPPLRRAGARQA